MAGLPLPARLPDLRLSILPTCRLHTDYFTFAPNLSLLLAHVKRSVLGRLPARTARKEAQQRRVNRSSPALIPARYRHPSLGTVTAMASSTPQEAQSAAQDKDQAQAQLQLPLRLATPGGGCMDGASSHAVTRTTQDSWHSATSVSGSRDVFSSLSELRDGQKPSSAAAAFGRGSVWSPPCLETLPSEVLAHIAGFLDVDDLLRASRTCHRLRTISLDPLLHYYRLRDARLLLPPLLSSPCRPSLTELMSRSIFLTNNSVISRRLARSLVSIRLSRRLASRPSARDLVQRSVLPQECVPGMSSVHVAPGLVAKRKAIEKERLKDGLSRWITGKWKGEVKEREEDARRYDEIRGTGRVWRLRRFWERMSHGELSAHQNRL